jgi:predicted AAA+ superfamily ATPase
MPHARPRYAQILIQKALGHSPIVGILGHRQVGKTTLAVSLSKEYITFDSASQLDEATQSPTEFLENRKAPFTVDETQLCPPLFPAAKEWVRTHPKKGQLIFTGSVRFTARKLIRESLTGRIVNVEILPMSISEMNGLPLTSHLADLFKINTSASLTALESRMEKKKSAAFLNYLETGGLPGICFFRDASVRSDRFEAHLDTILNRDLQLVTPTTLSSLQLRKLASFLAQNQGLPLELKAAARAAQTSTVTAKKLLLSFESLFLIRPIPTEGSVSKVSYFFEDQGLASFLSKTAVSQQDQILRGIYANLRQELHYRPHPKNEVFSYRTHDGTEVPLAFRTPEGVVGFIPSDEKTPTLKARGSAKSFQSHFPDAKVVITTTRDSADTRDFKTLVIPYWWLC